MLVNSAENGGKHCLRGLGSRAQQELLQALGDFGLGVKIAAAPVPVIVT
jgi:hypothetical protein